MNVNTEQLLAGINQYAEVDRFKQIITEIQEASVLGKIVKAVTLVPLLVTVVEKVHYDLADIQATGKEKKEAVVKWIDDMIEVPFYIEPWDDNLISIAVDAVVGFYNIVKGKQWLDSVKDFLGIE